MFQKSSLKERGGFVWKIATCDFCSGHALLSQVKNWDRTQGKAWVCVYMLSSEILKRARGQEFSFQMCQLRYG